MVVNIKDVAGLAGVNVSAVSLPPNNDPRISETTSRRVHDAAYQLNHCLNNLAHRLRAPSCHYRPYRV